MEAPPGVACMDTRHPRRLLTSGQAQIPHPLIMTKPQLDGGLVQSVDVPMPGHVLVDVDFRLDDLGRVGPDSVSRSFGGPVSDPGVAHLGPEILSFGFSPNFVTSADPSRFFFARTNETAFRDTGMTVTRSPRLDPNDPDSPARAPGNAITAVGRISSTFLPY